MKRKKTIIILLIIIALAAISLILPPTRSYIVMSFYSASENSSSVMQQNGFKIDVPSNSEWYPFVITFNPANFGRWSNTGADMSIMYNFAAFDIRNMSSDIFNPESDKHSSFYGAYALNQTEGYFGYNGDKIVIDEIVLTFKYDYKYLVLSDLGCSSPVFEVVDTQIKENITYLDLDGWTQIDAELKTNAMLHNYKENHTSYIQYGKPQGDDNEDFPVVKMYGRLYIRIFEEYNSTVIVYAMSPSMDVINECDNNLLQYTTIESLD